MTTTPVRHVLIIGGGASGTLLALHLLRSAPAGLRISLIERQPEAGRGLAYGAARPCHLLNVRSLNMSAYSNDPGHFANWLKRQAPAVQNQAETRFAPRLAFGRYLAEELQAAQRASLGRIAIDIVLGEARDVRLDKGDVSVSLTDGLEIQGDIAVVATGNELPPLDDEPWSRDPWSNPDLRDIKNPAPVLLLGSGLTMVDYVQSLLAAGFSGPLISISRRGLLPHVHGSADLPPLSTEQELPTELTALWRSLRAAARLAVCSGQDWRPIIDGIRPHSHRLWQALSLDDKRRFLRHARVWWDVHRHRMAPEVAATIHGLIETKRLMVIAGKIESIEPSAQARGGANVSFRRRGQHSISTLHAMRIVDCRGVVSDVWESRNPLVRALLKRDLARSHPLDLGFDVTASCALINRQGVASDRLYAIGPVTRGAFWETIAVPDIRAQCERMAREFAVRVPIGAPLWPELRNSAS